MEEKEKLFQRKEKLATIDEKLTQLEGSLAKKQHKVAQDKMKLAVGKRAVFQELNQLRGDWSITREEKELDMEMKILTWEKETHWLSKRKFSSRKRLKKLPKRKDYLRMN